MKLLLTLCFAAFIHGTLHGEDTSSEKNHFNIIVNTKKDILGFYLVYHGKTNVIVKLPGGDVPAFDVTWKDGSVTVFDPIPASASNLLAIVNRTQEGDKNITFDQMLYLEFSVQAEAFSKISAEKVSEVEGIIFTIQYWEIGPGAKGNLGNFRGELKMLKVPWHNESPP